MSSGGTVTISTDTMSARIPETEAQPLGSLGFERRQDASQPPMPTAGTSNVLSSTSASSSSPSVTSASVSATPTVITFPSDNGPPLLQIGKYNCTVQMRLDLLTGVLVNYLDVTSTTTGASWIVLSLDVHAAASILNPNAPSPDLSQDQLPTDGDLLSDVMKGNLSRRTYTPKLLRDQRSNLNSSWWNVEWVNRPMDGYYEAMYNNAQNGYTVDGWPVEAYIEFQEYYRLGISYGSVDEQMRRYNIGPDLDFMFPPGTFSEVQPSSVSSNGQVSSGCLFGATDTGITSDRNSSWAITTAPTIDLSANSDLMVPIPAITNLTSCGISPILNQTLAGKTAGQNPLPYAAYVRSTLWSFAPGEPLNDTSNTNNRCVVMSTSPHAGRWRVKDCNSRHRAACRASGEPYNWQVSTQNSDYNGGDSACTAPYSFSVPHTALENAHLLAALRATSNPNDPIFINLNARNVPECWVEGTNGTCPYLTNAETNRTRIVVVPTVAAVIIFVLAAFTFFVKCAANRRENKRGRRRKMLGGWEYEGVPS